MKAQAINSQARRIARSAIRPSCNLPRLVLFLELFIERPIANRSLK